MRVLEKYNIIALPRRLSTDTEQTEECGWTRPLEVQVPELHRDTFLSSAVHQGSYLTLYGFVLQQLSLCGNIEDERGLLTQMISWSHAVKPRFTFIAIYCHSSSSRLCPWLVPSSGVAGMTVYCLAPWCPVCLIYWHPCSVISTLQTWPQTPRSPGKAYYIYYVNSQTKLHHWSEM